MEILLVSHQPHHKITWQSRLLAYGEVVGFNLRVASGLEQNQKRADALIMVLDDPLTGTSLLLEKIRQAQDQGEHVVFVLLEDLYRDELQVQKVLREQGCHFIWDREFDQGDFYQMLFKPRRVQQKKVNDYIALEATENFSDEQLAREGDKEFSQGMSILKALEGLGFRKKLNFQQPVVSELPVSNKTLPRLKLCLFGNPSVAYEIGAVLASYYNQQVLLMDLDRLSPSADLYTGVNVTVKVQYDFFTKTSATGLNILFDCLKKGELHREAFIKASQRVKGIDGFNILTGSYQLSDFEYYRSEDLVKLVDRAAGYYDVIIMRTNGFPYDGFTLKAFAMADYIVGVLNTEIHEIRAYRQMVELLNEKQKIRLDKHFWLSHESKPIDPLENSFFQSLAGTPWIGSTDELEARTRCSRTGKGYLKSELKQLISMYIPLIDKIYRKVMIHEPSA